MNRYYIFASDQVAGPYTLDEIQPYLNEELQVCVEGTDEWRRAAEIPELAEILQPEVTSIHTFEAPEPAPQPTWVEGPPEDLPLTLRELWLICRNAESGLLSEQKQKHWKKYFKNEQAIISAEIERRGI